MIYLTEAYETTNAVRRGYWIVKQDGAVMVLPETTALEVKETEVGK